MVGGGVVAVVVVVCASVCVCVCVCVVVVAAAKDGSRVHLLPVPHPVRAWARGRLVKGFGCRC